MLVTTATGHGVRDKVMSASDAQSSCFEKLLLCALCEDSKAIEEVVQSQQCHHIVCRDCLCLRWKQTGKAPDEPASILEVLGCPLCQSTDNRNQFIAQALQKDHRLNNSFFFEDPDLKSVLDQRMAEIVSEQKITNSMDVQRKEMPVSEQSEEDRRSEEKRKRVEGKRERTPANLGDEELNTCEDATCESPHLTCDGCMNRVLEGNAFQLPVCRHLFCQYCLESLIAVALSDGALPNCPNRGGCRHPMTPDTVSKIGKQVPSIQQRCLKKLIELFEEDSSSSSEDEED